MHGSNWTVTKAPRDPRQRHPSHMLTDEVIREALDRGWDEVIRRKFSQPWVGEQFVRFMKTKRDYGKFMEDLGYSGTIPMNRDADTLPVASKGLGFSSEWRTYPFRRAIYVERKTLEIDEQNIAKGRQEGLMEMFKRTVEYVIADYWNRSFGVSGSQLLAMDGCYPIDEDRPNPDASADVATWSNKGPESDLSEDTLFIEELAASQQVDPHGNLFPQHIQKMVIPPRWKKKMWKLLETPQVLGNNHNDKNYASGAFDMSNVIVYDYLTIDAIFYWLVDPKSDDNELILRKRVEPEVKTEWGLGTAGNPDVLGMRLRADFGLSLGDVRKSIRGQLLSDSSS